MGIGDWGLGIGPNPQSPIPNPLSFTIIFKYYLILTFYLIFILNIKSINIHKYKLCK